MSGMGGMSGKTRSKRNRSIKSNNEIKRTDSASNHSAPDKGAERAGGPSVIESTNEARTECADHGCLLRASDAEHWYHTEAEGFIDKIADIIQDDGVEKCNLDSVISYIGLESRFQPLCFVLPNYYTFASNQAEYLPTELKPPSLSLIPLTVQYAIKILNVSKLNTFRLCYFTMRLQDDALLFLYVAGKLLGTRAESLKPCLWQGKLPLVTVLFEKLEYYRAGQLSGDESRQRDEYIMRFVEAVAFVCKENRTYMITDTMGKKELFIGIRKVTMLPMESDAIRISVMYSLAYHRTTHDPRLRRMLMDTYPTLLVSIQPQYANCTDMAKKSTSSWYVSGYDAYDMRSNVEGIILMMVRTRISQERSTERMDSTGSTHPNQTPAQIQLDFDVH